MSQDDKKQGCKYCDKKGLFWWPLRYAAVTADEPTSLSALPELTGTLGKGVTDIALDKARYAVRTLREGFIYVLSDRVLTEEQKKWRNVATLIAKVDRPGEPMPDLSAWDAYQVVRGGYLYSFSPEHHPHPVPEFTCNRHVCGIDASLIAIPDAENVNKVWVLFTPTPMTPRMLADYQKNADTYVAQGKMQSFSPKQWLAGQQQQAHSIKASELDSKLAEFILHKNAKPAETALGKALGSQLYPAIVDPYEGKAPDKLGGYAGQLGLIYNKLVAGKALGFALHDPIGITQELNDFRNAAIDQLRPWLQTTDAKTNRSNQHKLNVLGALQDVRDNLMAGVVSRNEEFLKRHKEGSDAWFGGQTEQAKRLRQQGRNADADAIDKHVAESLRVRDANYKEAVVQAKAQGANLWQKYAKRLPGMQPFEADLKRQTERIDQVAHTRVDDHLRWLKSAHMLNALHAYDRHDPKSGQEFQGQIGLALLGSNYTPKAFEVVTQWAQSERIDTGNLLLRAYSLNQIVLEQSVVQALAEAKRVAQAAPQTDWWKTLDVIQGAMKNAIDSFDKTNAALDDSPVGGGFHGSMASMGAVTYTLLGQALFKTGLGRQMSWMQQRYVALLSASLGRLNSKVRLSELANGGTQDLPNDTRSQGQATRRAREAIEAQIAKGPGGDAYKIRLAGAIALIEGFGLLMKASAKKDEKLTEDEAARKWRQAMEVMGAGLAVTAAGFEMLAVGVEMVQKHHRSVTMTSRGAAVSLGGIKLFAGALASVGGAVGAVYDAVDATAAAKKGQRGLALALATRSFAQGSLAILGAVIGYSFAGPMLDHLATRARSQLGRTALQQLAQGAYWLRPANATPAILAASRVAILIRVAAGFTWFGLAITVLMFIFADDGLEDWCDKSVFRAKPEADDKVYSNLGNEMEVLYGAFQEVR